MDECKPLPVGQRVINAAVMHLGRAVQINPIKPMLKAPETKRLTLKHDEQLSDVAFNFKLRRYASPRPAPPSSKPR